MKTLHLRYDPYDIFRTSRTPPGLYARQKWLQEESHARWKSDFETTVDELYQGQSPDGLWHGSPTETIHRLFGLHLTVRHSNPLIEKSLDNLLDIAASPALEKEVSRISPEKIVGIPFAPCSWKDFFIPSVLFLCCIFGKASDLPVVGLYENIVASLTASNCVYQDASKVHNIFRALVVHSAFSKHEATRSVVTWLGGRQTPQGDWGRDIPFYQALNALAHLDLTESEDQCSNAFSRLVNTQNRNGSWGETQQEWCTFLTIHALRNKNLL